MHYKGISRILPKEQSKNRLKITATSKILLLLIVIIRASIHNITSVHIKSNLHKSDDNLSLN